MWIKPTQITTHRGLFGVSSGTDTFAYMTNGDVINWQINGGTGLLTTTQLFRDVTAHGHLMFVWDSTSATANNRMRMYWEGQEITSFSSRINPAQNTDGSWNTAAAHRLGALISGTYFDGLISEVYFIDGQALTPSSFGETSTTTGAWNPKSYGGSYGTNGFKLNFSDNSGTTAATLGADTSGNGNNWTPNNFSVSAGDGNDSLTDTPTNYGIDTGVGGEVRGNFATLSPINLVYVATPSLSNGGLQFDTIGVDCGAQSAFPMASGKWYFEVTISNFGGAQDFYLGVNKQNASSPYGSNSRFYYRDGRTYNGSFASYGNSYTTGDVIGVAVDMDNGKLWFAKNGTWQASGDPASGTGAAFTDLAGSVWMPTLLAGSLTQTTICNFGQRAFAYTAPSGFKALCTQNLAEGSITTSGSFTGNANADGPVVSLNGVPTAMTINGNAVTFGTHADALAVGFKVRTSSASYNASGSNTYSVSSTGAKFKYARAV